MLENMKETVNTVKKASSAFIKNVTNYINEKQLSNILSESQINGVIIKDMNFANKNFKNKKFNNVKFINCNLNGADFTNTTLHNVKFINCNCNNSIFSRARVDDCKFIENSFSNVNDNCDVHFDLKTMLNEEVYKKYCEDILSKDFQSAYSIINKELFSSSEEMLGTNFGVSVFSTKILRELNSQFYSDVAHL